MHKHMPLLSVRAFTLGQAQTGLKSQGSVFLLSQAAVLPGSDAGSNVVKPALSFVIQNHQTSCFMWCLMYTWSAVCSAVLHSQFGEGARPHLCMDE